MTRAAVTDANGGFNFVSLAPANYELSAEAAGFAKTVEKLVLDTNQTLSVTITLSLKSVATSVEVTEQAPVLNPDESRNQTDTGALRPSMRCQSRAAASLAWRP